jgi:hypothetical protein
LIHAPQTQAAPLTTAASPSAVAAAAPLLQQLLASLGGGVQGGASSAPPAPTVDVSAVLESAAREVVGGAVDADAPLMEASRLAWRCGAAQSTRVASGRRGSAGDAGVRSSDATTARRAFKQPVAVDRVDGKPMHGHIE